MSTTLRLAVIADVHGNALALEAVLADIAQRAVEVIVNLGDNANGPLEPALSVALLRASGALHVRGNGDRAVAGAAGAAGASATFARERLAADDIAWLGELPFEVRGDGWVAFHSTPVSDLEYLVETVEPHGARVATAAEIEERLRGVTEPLVLCAHSHVPRAIEFGDGRLVVNPGSVGLPAYRQSVPAPHVMEAGTRHARYAIVERRGGRWTAELIALDYDWQQAAAQARSFGWEEWARVLETGRA